jgi:ferredoxin-NADP reductase
MASMASPPLFQRATVTRVIRENPDVHTFVLAPHGGPFAYRAGQFCTFRVRVDGRDLFRSYSMSSAPEADTELMTTVKRVPGGAVSNWLIDHLEKGDEVELTTPRGRFCLRPAAGPLLGFSGGSGITPILSLAKTTLASTDRPVRLLCADRDPASTIFDTVLGDLIARYPGRLTVIRHLDSESGLLDAEAVRKFVGPDTTADSYVCGPEPFMALVESALTGTGTVYSERFTETPPAPPAPTATGTASADATADSAMAPATASPETGGTVTIRLGNKRVSVPRRPDETLLESARRAGLTPPFSCEAGNCATCIAHLTDGTARMRVNDALTDEEVADGYVLTCQAVPETPSVTVRYE